MDLGSLFNTGSNSSSLEESIKNMENVANFFSSDNLSNLLNKILIYVIVIIILVIIVRVVINYFADKRRAKMIAKEVIKELEANGYTSQLKKDPPTTIE